jgi:hypothetical protein
MNEFRIISDDPESPANFSTKCLSPKHANAYQALSGKMLKEKRTKLISLFTNQWLL